MGRIRIGEAAPGFDLPSVDGKKYSLDTFRDKAVVVVMFTTNHCPYVQAYEDRLIAIRKDYASRGVALVAINSNEDKNYPEDSFENMITRAKNKGFNFPYLRDATQSVARSYGAQYTPEIFVFDKDRRLVYHGRIDGDWKEPVKGGGRDLREALDAALEGRLPPKPETQAFGCTIKWA